jgi:hypothetical protein
MLVRFLPAVVCVALLAACSLTDIPDTSSQWQDPCTKTGRLCAHTFTLPKTTQMTAELRGDFAPDAWVTGVPMALDGGSFSASVTVPYGSDVQYKFFVDGTTWILDPANSATVPDGKGNTNNILRDVTCEQWTCAPAQ